MWNVIKKINQEHLPPSSADTLPSRVTSVSLEGHQPSPCSQMLQSLWWAQAKGHSRFCHRIPAQGSSAQQRELVSGTQCTETFLMVVIILTTFIAIFSGGIIIINVFIVTLWVGAGTLSFFAHMELKRRRLGAHTLSSSLCGRAARDLLLFCGFSFRILTLLHGFRFLFKVSK